MFKQQILKKGNGQVPIKAQGARSDISKYGGYDKAMSTSFAYAEYEEKGKKKFTDSFLLMLIVKRIIVKILLSL
ncbi:MAG: hypothetical protein LUG95_08925 [Clostridiales bacterium]|nr:hypothetical protein [Clostridiales bacterium]